MAITPDQARDVAGVLGRLAAKAGEAGIVYTEKERAEYLRVMTVLQAASREPG